MALRRGKEHLRFANWSRNCSEWTGLFRSIGGGWRRHFRLCSYLDLLRLSHQQKIKEVHVLAYKSRTQMQAIHIFGVGHAEERRTAIAAAADVGKSIEQYRARILGNSA